MTLLMAVAVAIICARAGMENITYILTGFSIGWIFKATSVHFEQAMEEAMYRLYKDGYIDVVPVNKEDEDERK